MQSNQDVPYQVLQFKKKNVYELWQFIQKKKHWGKTIYKCALPINRDKKTKHVYKGA